MPTTLGAKAQISDSSEICICKPLAFGSQHARQQSLSILPKSGMPCNLHLPGWPKPRSGRLMKQLPLLRRHEAEGLLWDPAVADTAASKNHIAKGPRAARSGYSPSLCTASCTARVETGIKCPWRRSLSLSLLFP